MCVSSGVFSDSVFYIAVKCFQYRNIVFAVFDVVFPLLCGVVLQLSIYLSSEEMDVSPCGTVFAGGKSSANIGAAM